MTLKGMNMVMFFGVTYVSSQSWESVWGQIGVSACNSEITERTGNADEAGRQDVENYFDSAFYD